ncbi:MAG: recombinase RecT [Ruminococcus sp.]|nr:recombinase RecT [Ruminococcus sp.]
MSNANAIQTKPKFSVAIQTEQYQKLINNTLGDPERARRFIASISSAVATNPSLQDCNAGTILSGALLGEALNLSPSPQLGQYYLVPFEKKVFNKDTKKWEVVDKNATFVLGYKGYIQLAIRSGNYKKINVIEIKDGELENFDLMTEEIKVNLIQDDELREQTKTIGYYAMFEYLNGFKKAIYWSKNKMLAHADKYSPAFSKKGYELLEAGKVKKEDEYKYSSHWYKNFDDMAKKTMLRQLISKWGVMSIEMREAFEKDETIQNADGSYNYISELDDKTIIETEIEENNNNPKKVDMNEL